MSLLLAVLVLFGSFGLNLSAATPDGNSVQHPRPRAAFIACDIRVHVFVFDGETGLPVSGAVVEFRESTQYGVAVWTGTTDSGGEIFSRRDIDTDGADIEVTVLAIPAGYYLPAVPPYSAHLEYGTPWTSISFNLYTPEAGVLIIRNIDKITKLPIDGNIFRVTHVSGAEIGEFTCDSDGKIEIPDLPVGVYYVEEISTISGYIPIEYLERIGVFKSSQSEALFENMPEANLTITAKEKISRELMGGVTFRITEKGGPVVGEFTTETGEDLNIALDGKTYIIKMIEVPSGYYKHPAKEVQLVNGQHDFVGYELAESPILTIWAEEDVSGAPVAGVIVDVVDEFGNSVARITTKSNAGAVLDSLPAGTYRLSVFDSGINHQPSSETAEVTLRDGQQSGHVFHVHPYAKILINLTDKNSGEGLGGAVFRVTEKGGAVVGEFTTDESGMAEIGGLDGKIYTIEEITAPEGYVLETPQDIQAENGEVTEVNFDGRYTPVITIVKEDKSGNPAEGEVYVVKDGDGNVMAEVTTG
jgi:uncharacterized surface anchored protein